MKKTHAYTLDEELGILIKEVSKEKKINESWIVNKILRENIDKFREEFK
jgi:hypothetical protein